MADIQGGFEKVLKEAIQRRLEEIVEEETVTAAERVRRRCKEQIPQILVGIQKRFSVETCGQEMRITISLDDRSNKPPG